MNERRFNRLIKTIVEDDECSEKALDAAKEISELKAAAPLRSDINGEA
jgi:hypothetical protein